MSVNFRLQETLTVDDNPNGDHEEELDGVLLIADFTIFTYHAGHCKEGFRVNEIIPAFWKGERSFLQRWHWCAESPYCADGIGEEILSFEDGAKLLLEKGAFQWCFKSEEKGGTK